MMVISRAEFNHEILRDVKVAQAIIHLMVGRIRGITKEVSCLALLDVYGRLVRVLNSSASELENSIRVTWRITHQELASRVRSSR